MSPTSADQFPEVEELQALDRMVRRADGFRLGFVIANHPLRVDSVTEELATRWRPKAVATVSIDDPGASLVSKLAQAARGEPVAIFVRGFERLRRMAGGTPAVRGLNLNRDRLRSTVPVPVVFFGPEYAIRRIAAEAPDLWAVRSGVFRFRPEAGTAGLTAAVARREIDWSTAPEQRRDRAVLLDHILEELDENDGSPEDRAEALAGLARAASMKNRYADAIALYEQALPIYRDTGDRLGEASTLKALGDAARMQSRYPDAIALYDQALAISREIGDGLDEANTLRSLGDAALMQGRYPDAIALYDQALAISREIGDRLGEANALWSLGDAALMQGRYPDATALYDQALPLYTDIGHPLGEANTLRSLGDAADKQSRYPDAIALYDQALPIYRDIGDRRGEANILQSLGQVARMQRRYPDAIALYDQALPIYREIGDAAERRSPSPVTPRHSPRTDLHPRPRSSRKRSAGPPRPVSRSGRERSSGCSTRRRSPQSRSRPDRRRVRRRNRLSG